MPDIQNTDPTAPPSAEVAMKELVEFATSGPILVPRLKGGDDNNRRVRQTQLVLDTEFMAKACLSAWATVLYHSRHGSLKAGMYILDRCLGAPVQSVTVSASSMSMNEVKEALMAEYLGLGLAEYEARSLVEAAERGPDELEEQNERV